MAKIEVDLTSIHLPCSCIQLLKPVLDEAYERIPMLPAAKDLAIKGRLKQLSESYADLRQGEDIEYDEPITRFAYIYRYVACHANIVREHIADTQALRELFTRDRVAVTSLGGGPGSEILGIAQHLRDTGASPKVSCTVYDRDQSWADSWHNIHEKLDLSLRFFPMFKYLDVKDAKSWQREKEYLSSDLFSMVFFLSEVYKHKEAAEEYFTHLFENAKSGALFLVVDNSSGGFKEWFDEMAHATGLQFLDAGTGKFQMHWVEEKSDFGDYYTKFASPRITAWIAWRVAVKS